MAGVYSVDRGYSHPAKQHSYMVQIHIQRKGLDTERYHLYPVSLNKINHMKNDDNKKPLSDDEIAEVLAEMRI